MNILDQINQKCDAIFQEVVDIRRHIHANPELSFEEHETSAFIQNKLTEYGIPFKAGFVKTGILARIDGKLPGGKVIALRADMDALPILEANNTSYCSKNNGVMHACGHDVHSANLLGVAKVLKSLEDEFAGTVLLIFQPGEEVNPGGAKLMLDEGLFNEIKPEIIVGLHVLPDLPAGTVGFRSGMYMASGDEIYINVKGKGGHGALPHKLTDNVLAAADIITSLQHITSRNAPADIPTVLSFGKVIANGATNIIPERVEMAGTLRTMNEPWRAKAKERIKEVAESVAKSYGAEAEVIVDHGYPVLYNDEKITAIAKSAAEEILGADKVVDMGLRMTCEDFAYYSLDYPVTFYRIGVKDPSANETSALHTSTFDIDETALKAGMKSMTAIAINLLK
ncbi:amidohydrolase [Prolixibacteraceae bacterium JC049]|nr:amidohydrolase [Prolixibacteraceae bacterium JC049]